MTLTTTSLAGVQRVWSTARAAAPTQFTTCVAFVALSAVADGLAALWLALAVGGVLTHDYPRAQLFGILLAVTSSVVLICERSKLTLRKQVEERTALALQQQQLRSLLRPDALSVLESPEMAANLETLRRDRSISGQAAGLLLEDVGFVIRSAISVILLTIVSPLLLLLLLVAVVTIWAAGKAEQQEQEGLRQCAFDAKEARHLLHVGTDPRIAGDLLTSPDPGRLVDLHAAARARVDAGVGRARMRSARVMLYGWIPFVVAASATLAVAASQQQADAVPLVLVFVVISQLVGQLSLSNEMSRLVVRLAAAHTAFDAVHRRMTRPSGAAPSDKAHVNNVAAQLPTPVLPCRLEEGIALRNLTFSYPGGTPVLRDVNLALRAETVVALVGANGSGKSTLAKVLLGLHQPDSGDVVIDGIPLSAVPVDVWQSHVTASLQDFARFEFTAGRSVGLGYLPKVDDDSTVARAVRAADATEFFSGLSAGLQTPLGPSFIDGEELSRGQWQRLALARSRMRERVLLYVLDEPTASLDAATEAHIYRQVSRVPGAVTLLVTHRLATTRIADWIVVLDSGAVTEQGTHEALMAARGVYFELYTTQAAAYHNPGRSISAKDEE